MIGGVDEFLAARVQCVQKTPASRRVGWYLSERLRNDGGMGTPPYYFGRREQADFHRKPNCSLFQQFDVQCLCGTHNIKIVVEADEEGLKVYLFCPTCRRREELRLHMEA